MRFTKWDCLGNACQAKIEYYATFKEVEIVRDLYHTPEWFCINTKEWGWIEDEYFHPLKGQRKPAINFKD